MDSVDVSRCTYCPLRWAGSPRSWRSVRARATPALWMRTVWTLTGPLRDRKRCCLHFPSAWRLIDINMRRLRAKHGTWPPISFVKRSIVEKHPVRESCDWRQFCPKPWWFLQQEIFVFESKASRFYHESASLTGFQSASSPVTVELARFSTGQFHRGFPAAKLVWTVAICFFHSYNRVC